MTESLERSLEPGRAHHLLTQLVGTWEGTARTYFRPGVLGNESTIAGSIRPVLGGRFAVHEYESSMDGEPLQGIAVHGFDLARSVFVTAWIDSFHNGTGVMLSEAGGSAASGFSVLGSYGDDPDAQWGWRTTIDIPGPNELEITHFNITPDGDEAVAVEIAYRRSTG